MIGLEKVVSEAQWAYSEIFLKKRKKKERKWACVTIMMFLTNFPT